MSFFNRARNLAANALSRLAPQSGSLPLPSAKSNEPHPWDPSFRIMDLTQEGDWLTLSDLFTGIAVFGAAGSGKTSSLALIAYSLMLMDCGFVWLCAKPDEVRLVRKIAKEAGREQDIIVIGADEDGHITPHRFNALDYETSIATNGTTSVVQYLSDAAKVLSKKEGERSSGDGERFWNDQFDRLLRYTIDTAKLAGRTLSVGLLRTIQLTAPKNKEELSNDEWAAKSVCWRCLNEAYERLEKGEIAQEDFDRISTFWTIDYMGLDVKPRGTIDVMFAVLADAFSAEEPVRSIFTTTTTVTPEDVIEHGKIVVLSLPTNVYHSAGRMGQFLFKYSYQRAMLRRLKPANGALVRPTVLWIDEAHAFAHAFDQQYFAEVRSNRGINIFLEQGVGGYMRALGLHSVAEVDGFLQNLATKIFFQNSSPQTNEFAADVIGKLMLAKSTTSTGAGTGGSVNIGSSQTEEVRHQIVSGQFAMLKRGGVENNLIVEGVVTLPGKIFSTTGTNYATCLFPQTELTR